MKIIPNPKRVRRGDIFGFELRNGKWAVGIVIHISKIFTSAMLISFFDKEYDSPDDISVDSLGDQMIIIGRKSLPNYTAKVILIKGPFKYLGKYPEIAYSIPLPVLGQGRACYRGGDVIDISEVDDEEYLGPIIGLGLLSIEEDLFEYFKRNR